MTTLRRTFIAVLAAACTACSATTSSTADTPGGTTAPATMTASSAPAVTASTAKTASGMCRIIDLAAATQLLGGTPKQLTPPAVTDAEATKLDGCSYSGTDPSLGYDVNDVHGPAVTFLAAAKQAMGKQPGTTPFDVALGDASLGFTVATGSKTLARVEVAKGTLLIAVAVTGTNADKARATALAATRTLVAQS